MDHLSGDLLERLPLRDLLHGDEHAGAIKHEDLCARLQRSLAPEPADGARIDGIIDALIARRWLMPLTLWRCPAADGWPSPITVYRRGPDCPEAPLSA